MMVFVLFDNLLDSRRKLASRLAGGQKGDKKEKLVGTLAGFYFSL
ncbi:MAG: hypothetical protein ACTSVS_00040 [Candidatus Heimdallarchaeota archaeon]